MSTSITQHNENGRLAGEIRRSVHAQFFVLGQTSREIGRRYGMHDREVEEIAREMEARRDAAAIKDAFNAGRRSLLTQYAKKAGMN